jgi:hypothetical protein
MAEQMGVHFATDKPKFSNSKKTSAQIEQVTVPNEEHRTVIDTSKHGN